MTSLFRSFLRPIRNPGFLMLFLSIFFILTGMLSFFMRPGNLDGSDFLQASWYPGQELLKTGAVYAGYPYPLWTVVVTLPIAVWPQQTAILIMFFCNMLMLSASLTLFILTLDWELTPALLAMTVSLSGFFLPILSSLWLGQLTIFLLFILSLTIHFYLQQRWVWLGVVLGLSFIKPHVMILLAGILLLQAILQRRWRVVAGFALVIILFVIISLPFISNPAQIIGGGILSILEDYILFASTLWGVVMSLGLPWIIPFVISLIMLAWLGWIWLPFLRASDFSKNRMLYLFSACVMVNLIAIPYSLMHNLTLLLLPFGYCLSLILKMRSYSRIIWLILLFVIMHPLMVGLYLVLGIPQKTQAYQIIPALILLPLMAFLEYNTSNKENLNVQPSLSR